MRDVVIVSAARTPIGSFGGALKSVPTRTLGAIAVKGSYRKSRNQTGRHRRSSISDVYCRVVWDRTLQDRSHWTQEFLKKFRQ